jgi:glutathione S-transferase
MLTIYHVPGTRGVRAIWLCEELGLPYTVETVDFSPEFRRSAQWRALNPVGKVPVLRDTGNGDFVMFESGAMVQYILDRYGNGQLQPAAGTPAHALYLQWSWFAEATFARPLGEVVNHGREFPGDKKIDAVVAEMLARGHACAEAVGTAIGDQPFILGETFSAADIMLGYTLMLAERFLPDGLPATVEPYWQRLAARPAFQKSVS